MSSDPTSAGGKVVRPLYYTYVDPHRMQEVLTNLINNAIKYTPEGGVTVTLTGDQTLAQIQVSDTGPGISQDDLPHLFQKFYRVDNSMTRTIGGTGLGLFICRKIVELYNGRIWAESELNKGTTFFVNLPRLSTSQALDMQQKQASTISPLDSR
jgi:two-component system sensor histidine kinase VicK